MTDPVSGQVFIVAWSFTVRPAHRCDFENAYGPNGEWVRLFRASDGYIKTELHRDPDNAAVYITLDFWRSREQYEAFRERAKSAYQTVDASCERLTENEELLGEFADFSALQASLPRLRSTTLLRSPLTVRAASPEDIPNILLVERSASSAAHWTEAAYEAIFGPTAPRRIALVAETLEERLSGFVIARMAAGECELENIAVDPAEVRQGIGSALLQKFLDAARAQGIHRILLEVRESNLAARRLYEKLGFALDGERSGYYRSPDEKGVLYSLRM